MGEDRCSLCEALLEAYEREGDHSDLEREEREYFEDYGHWPVCERRPNPHDDPFKAPWTPQMRADYERAAKLMRERARG